MRRIATIIFRHSLKQRSKTRAYYLCRKTVVCKAVLGIVILKPIITIFIKQKVNPIILWEATSKTELLQELQAFGVV